MTPLLTEMKTRRARLALVAAASLAAIPLALLARAALGENAAPPTVAQEEIYVLRSIREQRQPSAEGCLASRTGFEPLPADAERFFSFWSLRLGAEDGKVVDAKVARVAELRGCLGPTHERARQRFHAEVRLGAISFIGTGECLAMAIDSPETGLFPVRCQLVLSGMPAPYVGGLLTTNTLASQAAFGGDTDPPGYTQASIATIRLWKAR